MLRCPSLFLSLGLVVPACTGPGGVVVDGATIQEPQSPRWEEAVAAGLEAQALRYELADGAFRSAGGATGLRSIIKNEGASVLGGGALVVRLSTVAWGAGERRPFLPASPREGACAEPALVDFDGDCLRRIERVGTGLVEWWRHGPDGVQQGWELSTIDGSGPVTLEVQVDGASPVGSADGGAWLIGAGVLHYGAPAAWDATGRTLAAWLEVEDGSILVTVETNGATAPVVVDPLITTVAWATQGTATNAALGTSVAGAGDVNQDGYGDIVVGVPDLGNGAAWVFHGSASGPVTSPSWSITAANPNADLGAHVGTAGDMNGDGYSDLFVGAPNWDNGGMAFVYLGSSSGLGSSAALTIQGSPGQLLGLSGGSAGDVNADGYADLLVGAPGWDNGSAVDAGRVRLYLGAASLSTSPSWTLTGASGDRLGQSAVGTGDMSGDGYGDVAIGVPLWDNGTVVDAGQVRIFRGNSSGLSTSPWWTMTTAVAQGLTGWSVGRANDVNGDGYADLLIGSPGMGPNRVGQVASIHGNATNPIPAGRVWSGTDAGSSFGWSVAGAGDLNGDGFGDAVIGAPWDRTNAPLAAQGEGQATAILGTASGLSATPVATWTGPSTGAHGGYSVAGVGDCNGDGYGELMIGAPQADSSTLTGAGSAVLFSGAPSSVGATAISGFEPNTHAAYLGAAVAPAGDLNSDGFGDVVVGAWGFGTPLANTPNEGRAWVLSGANAGISSWWSWESNLSGAQAGFSVAGGSDLNGDTWADLAVGAPGADNGSGRVYLFAGSASGLASTPTTILAGTGGEAAATSLATGGDWNGDGVGDLVVGAPNWDSTYVLNVGLVRVYLGGVGAMPGTVSWSASGTVAGETLGTSVAFLPDANGDGLAELVAGGPLFSNGQVDEGRAAVWYGSVSAASSAPSWTWEGNQIGARASIVAPAGDLNADGYSDLLIGAPRYGLLQSGRAWAILGSASGLASTAWLTVDGSEADARLGASLGGTGDVNGDGYGDIVLGAWAQGLTDVGRAEIWLGGPTAPPTWDLRIDGTQGGQHLGVAVSAAGDANGDGYGDLLIGSDLWDNGSADEGRVFLHLGNQRDGVALGHSKRFRATLPNMTRRLPSGSRSSTNAIDFRATVRTVAGPGRTRLAVEAKAHGTPWNAQALVRSPWIVTGTSGADVTLALPGLPWDSVQHVRARILASPADAGPFLQGPWLPGTTVGEPLGPHARTACDAGTDIDNDWLCDAADPDDDGDLSLDAVDCDPLDASIFPGAPEVVGDGIDQNCSGWDLVQCYPDQDLDGHGSGESVSDPVPDDSGACGTPALPGAPNGDDCNDADATIHPGAMELCDGQDTDCDGAIAPTEFDFDGDGARACVDCDDSDPTVFPNAPEACDGLDSNCDGSLPSNETDPDLDGVMACAGDCGPTVATIYPWAPEACDGLDDDCDGSVPATEQDADQDGQRPCAGDCNDANAFIYAGALPRCDGWDNDCDGALETSSQEVDADLDLYLVCTLTAGPVNPAWNGGSDCADTNAAIHPGAPEVCNGVDDNCVSGISDEGVDADLDGTTSCTDCDDGDDNVEPGAPEICDGKDSDCVGGVPASEADADADGWVSCTLASQAHPPANVAGGGDCDDTAFAIHPGATELCDGLDGDCTGGVPADEADADADGTRPCGGDCDDQDPLIEPGAPELCDGLDNDCNLLVPATESDADLDAVWPCAGDCNDASSLVHLGAPELCDGLDNDCDGAIPGDETDGDGDGFDECQDLDCDDTDPTIYLGAPAVCDGLDNNCDGLLSASEQDDDGDGLNECAGLDCDDADATRYPGAVETCDGIDQDCDGSIDEGFDTDGDGVTICAGDCDDGDPAVQPLEPEVCDGLDQDCDLIVDEGFDADLDLEFPPSCPGGQDCDDSNAGVGPNFPELCDALDNDCDGTVDNGFDADGDGFPTAADPGCAAAWPEVDCDDADGSVFPGGAEACNGADDDCSGAPGADEVDADLDGFDICQELDCDDGDPDAFPGGPELCDGADNDCDTAIDETFDQDGDGAMDGSVPFCLATYGALADCDDTDPLVSPFLPETCDLRDDDCDGEIDEGWDGDGDGVTPCAGDCDDADAARRPGLPEVCGNGVDENCSGVADEDEDQDGDLITTCAGDCDDTNPTVFPNAPETCDGVDQDCDLQVDDGLDQDGDGVTPCAGDCDDGSALIGPAVPETCDGIDQDCDGAVDDGFDLDEDGASACAGDCDDTSPGILPGAPELCDGVDQDCDGQLDEDFDQDGDGAYDPAASGCATVWPGSLDCDDNDPARAPGAPEICDGLDDDCEGSIPTEELDQDGDGVMPCQGDCDDLDPLSEPGGIEWCNGADDDCDGQIDPLWDLDGDGWVDASVPQCEVLAPSLLDCNDAEDDIHPGAVEVCNGVDDDCSGAADEPFDQDGDGAVNCGEDCDDADPNVFPGNVETCPNGIDDNCDGAIDENVDTDGDGSSPCAGDCDDGDAARGPTVLEVCNGVDDDCDLLTDDGFDQDGDGQTTCAGDCADNSASIHTGATETCDDEDDDCDLLVDETFDLDEDGYFDYLGTGCAFQHPASELDCDDRDPNIHPGAVEACDSAVDEDCDGDVDEDDTDCQGDDDSGDDDSAGDDDSGDDDSAGDDDSGDDDSVGDDDAADDDASDDDRTIPEPLLLPGCYCGAAQGRGGVGLALLLFLAIRRRAR